MSEAVKQASDYVTNVFSEIWLAVESSFKSVEDEGFIFAMCAQLEALVTGAEARLEQKFADENVLLQFKEELVRFEKILDSFEDFEEEDFKLFCKFYQPTLRNDPIVALDLVENFENI